ncbi:pilus assembly protein [Roseateles sp.]|jgi:type IV pilus assembly protein PilY1|uniref:pilus assembly protein n=1 Tax=Roseateles sp. TaxID=1971397 RepID=UPI00391DB25C
MIKNWIRQGPFMGAWLLSLLWPLVSVHAAPADLADRPLASTNSGVLVRSNLMFVLDDSGSMNWNYLPDDAPRNNVCFGAADSNFVFFNPDAKYPPPLYSNGTSMPNASFSSAWNDGFRGNASGTVNLSGNNPETPYVYGPQKSYNRTQSSRVCGSRNSWQCDLPSPNPSSEDSFNGTDTTTTLVTVSRVAAPGFSRCSTAWNSCALLTVTEVTVTAGAAGQFLWAKRKSGASPTSCNVADFDVVRASSSLSADQQTNYANWYSYYRTRMLAMRTGAGKAFAKIDASRFRVGFSKISEHANGGADSTGFLNVRDYDTGSQKTEFFTRLYGTVGSSNTPLRPALARAGRYYANKLSGQSDPVQYSCQRNYTILSTDGYWNQDSSSPLNLLGSTGVGNPDGGSAIERPMRDAANNGSGVSDTLADVAMYYYVNDLRTETLGNCSGAVANQNVCENNVPSDNQRDTNTAQHMTTFTLGLGISGTLAYDKDYLTQTGGDFFAIKQGTKNWPDPIANTGPERIDDLWHAAVNGRGVYYSASNADAMAASLVDALEKIDSKTGSGGAAATSTLSLQTSNDANWAFLPLYTTDSWTGDVKAYKLRGDTAELVSPNSPVWSAADRIASQTSRRILFKNGSSLSEFTYANLPSTAKAHFEGACGSVQKLSQCPEITAGARAAMTGEAMVNYLRGDKSREMTATNVDARLFRSRAGPLGDIVGGAPVYVGKPPLSYGETYKDFATDNSTRQAVLYVAANDGMLHALKVSDDNTGGQELWAYVPGAVMKDMYLLADTRYASKHRFYVDGAPVVGDVQDGTSWRTILVGGLGKGGRAYYALDVTDPMNPRTLWEYTDDDLGFSYGNPVITKNKAGKWIVAFTSGYNNVSPGTGRGYLYVLDAITGTRLDKIEAKTSGSTFVGDTATPSNLGRLNAWVDDNKANVAQRFYAGDMLGNVWRFDFDDNYGAAGKEAFLLAQVGSNQPITTKPVLSEVVEGAYRYQLVSVATGRYLGFSDVGDTAVQSVYTFKDKLDNTSLGALRSNSGMVKQTINSARNGLDNPKDVTWSTQTGWYVDLSMTAGERVNVDMTQQLNQLMVAGNIPNPTACNPGGTGWLYFLDVGSGKPLASYGYGNMVVGGSLLQTTTGQLRGNVLTSDGKFANPLGGDLANLAPGAMRRTSWRELAN